MSDPRARARELARDAIARGDATGWFEQLYVESERDGLAISWVDLAPNPYLVEWLERKPTPPRGRALVVGCGYGDDAEFLAGRGLEVTAFDIAPSAVARCRSRFPGSRVRYLAADALRPPADWVAAFDLDRYGITTIGPVPAEYSLSLPGVARTTVPRGRCRGR